MAGAEEALQSPQTLSKAQRSKMRSLVFPEERDFKEGLRMTMSEDWYFMQLAEFTTREYMLQETKTKMAKAEEVPQSPQAPPEIQRREKRKLVFPEQQASRERHLMLTEEDWYFMDLAAIANEEYESRENQKPPQHQAGMEPQQARMALHQEAPFSNQSYMAKISGQQRWKKPERALLFWAAIQLQFLYNYFQLGVQQTFEDTAWDVYNFLDNEAQQWDLLRTIPFGRALRRMSRIFSWDLDKAHGGQLSDPSVPFRDPRYAEKKAENVYIQLQDYATNLPPKSRADAIRWANNLLMDIASKVGGVNVFPLARTYGFHNDDQVLAFENTPVDQLQNAAPTSASEQPSNITFRDDISTSSQDNLLTEDDNTGNGTGNDDDDDDEDDNNGEEPAAVSRSNTRNNDQDRRKLRRKKQKLRYKMRKLQREMEDVSFRD